MTFLIRKSSKIHLINPKNNFLEIGHVGYQKIYIVVLVSKIQTYISDKMHPKGDNLKKTK